MALLFNMNIQTEYILIARANSTLWFLACKENIFLHKKVSVLQGILDDINEQDTSFLDCKHKHMKKSGAPPENFRVLPRLFSIEFKFNASQAELISKSY